MLRPNRALCSVLSESLLSHCFAKQQFNSCVFVNLFVGSCSLGLQNSPKGRLLMCFLPKAFKFESLGLYLYPYHSAHAGHSMEVRRTIVINA